MSSWSCEPSAIDVDNEAKMTTLADLIGPANVYDVLPRVLAAAALDGVDVGDLLGHACSEATRQLPRGMDLTCNRSGSWEAGHIEGLTDPSAVLEGPGPDVLEVECLRCGASAGNACWFTDREARLYASLMDEAEAARRACALYDLDDWQDIADDGETVYDVLLLDLPYSERDRPHGARASFARDAKMYVPGWGWVL